MKPEKNKEPTIPKRIKLPPKIELSFPL